MVRAVNRIEVHPYVRQTDVLKITPLYSSNSFCAKWYRLLLMNAVSWPLMSTRQM